MIDFNNTWCEATEENYKALIRLDYTQIGYENKIATLNSKFLIPVTTPAGNRVKGSNINSNKRQIHLVNGKFQYVEIKPKNNFKDYGFEADFEGHIYERDRTYLLGKVRLDCDIKLFRWNYQTGICREDEKYNLKPIKKEWYENPENFPCLVIHDNKESVLIKYYNKTNNKLISKDSLVHYSIDRCRPATKEEVLALLVKE